MERKVAIIGLDGATWSILSPAIERGYMENLGQLLDCGSSGDLYSTSPPITPVAWSSFLTGANPGKHSISGFAQPRWSNGSPEFKMNNSENISAPTLWEYLSKRGKEIVSLNLPMTYPPFSVDGILVSGLFTPNSRKDFVYPNDLQESFQQREFKPYIKHIAGDLPNCKSKDEYKSKVEEVKGLVEKKFEQAYYADQQSDWDVFFMQIQETDPIQHFLMGFMEEDHDWYDSDMQEFLFSNFYGEIDRMIGELLEDINPDGLNLVVSDHGFQTSSRAVHLGNWLVANGFATPSTTGTAYRKAIELAKKLDVFDLRRFVPGSRKIAKQKESMTFDWSESSAISIGAGNNPIAPIYILETGAKRDAILQRLKEGLSDFTDPTTGGQVVEEIIAGDDIYSGRYTKEMPDILVKATDEYTFRTTLHKDQPTIMDLVETTNRPGIHHEKGILMAAGDSTATSKRNLEANLVDLAPTILYYLDEPIPDYMDGDVLSSIFDDEFREEHEASYTELPAEREIDSSADYSKSDEDDLKDKLSALGYID